jgi:hypothetical protein
MSADCYCRLELIRRAGYQEDGSADYRNNSVCEELQADGKGMSADSARNVDTPRKGAEQVGILID